MHRAPNQSPGSVSSIGGDFTASRRRQRAVERIDVVDREPDMTGAGPFQREGRAIGGTDVFEQLQHLPVTQIEVGAQQPGAGHAGDPLDLVARELPDAPYRELEQIAVERE